MRIEPSRISRVAQGSVSEVGRAEVNGTRPAQSVAQGDQVVLSQRASEVQLARETLASVPQVRARRIAELKRQILSGAFRVDADKVADKIIAGS